MTLTTVKTITTEPEKKSGKETNTNVFWQPPSYLLLPWKILFFAGFLLTIVQYAYIWAYEKFGDSHLYMLATGTFVVHMICFYGKGLIFQAPLDLMRFPSFLVKYKIQPDLHVSGRQYLHIMKVVLINQIMLLFPLLCSIVPIAIWRGIETSPAAMPDRVSSLFSLFLFLWVEEVGFYYSHRWLHSKMLYKSVHKWHHMFTAPVGIASAYAHPFEFLLSNFSPLAMGPLIFGGHPVLWWWWAAVATMGTLTAHGGYNFPWNPFGTAEAHDLHHELFTVNFGSPWIDKLNGTFRDGRPLKKGGGEQKSA